MRRRLHRLFHSPVIRPGIAFLLVLAALTSSAGNLAAAPPRPVTLPGHVLKRLSQATRLGSLPPGQALTLTIALRPRAAAALNAAATHAGQPPGGRGRWLSPRAVGQAYGQSTSNIDALAAYFKGYGLSVSPPAADQLSFQVHGTVAQIEQALAVSLDDYRDPHGKRFYATPRNPRLPGNLAPSVQAILGLNDYPALQPAGLFQARSPGSYIPADMQKAYGVTPLYHGGFTGAGQTIGILGCDTFQLSDIRAFESLFDLPQAQISQTPIDGGPSSNQIETTLDLEWASAIAPDAALRYYGFDCSFQGLYDALATVASENVASIVSISLGACESAAGDAVIQAVETQFEAIAAQGQSVFVASGDQGAYACGDSTLSVDYPASSAYVTAVGGTSLTLQSDGSYGSESAWGAESGDCNGPCGSGGGVSAFIAKPAWQSQVNTTAYREVPDVAYNGDPATGNVVYFDGSLQSGWGGTSIGAPQWAGIAALANQAAATRLGPLDPLLYSASVVNAPTPYLAAYHDVTTGNNLYYNATPGWDLATGWGSPRACNLVHALLSRSTEAAPAAVASGGFRLYFPLVANQSVCGW